MNSEKNLWETIKDKPYCDPTCRMDFVLLFDVKNGNPNGDPDAGNLPRMDPTTRHGIVTDVSTKRKIRDYLASVLGRPIYIQSSAALNSLYFRAAQEIASYDPDKDKSTSEEEKAQRVAAKEAVAPLYRELSSSGSPEFKLLIATVEDNETTDDDDEATEQTDSSEDESEKTFREWLAEVEIDGLEFDAAAGVLTFLGEAKTKSDFQRLLGEDESAADKFKQEIAKLAGLLGKAKPSKKGRGDERAARKVVSDRMCESYDDIRLFGAVLTAGTNAGQIRGPLQLVFGRSTEPILPLDAAITRCAITKAADWKRKQTEFGRKPWLSYAAYEQHGFFNPLLAEETGVSREDLARFWEAVACMFQQSASASKGEMATKDLVVFVHRSKWGKAPSHKLFGRTRVVSGNGAGPSLEVDDETKISEAGIEIHRPLVDMWGAL